MFKRLSAFFLSFGLGNEKEFFVDNLSVLLNSGMDILTSLEAISAETKSGRLRMLIRKMATDVENGERIWRAMASTRLFSPQVIALAHIGEETGRLVENLRVIVQQQQKDRMFRAKLLGAVMYPALIVVLSIAVGLWALFYLLPQLANTFASLNIDLPILTRIFMAVGEYSQAHWEVLLPGILFGIFTVILVCFCIPRTRFIGQFFLFHVPGLGRLLKDTETGRIGFLLGTMLHAGVDLVEALRSVAHATNFAAFGAFYAFVADRLEEGGTFDQAFHAYRKSRRFLSIPMQQLVSSAERSGSVPQAFASIGELYQFRADMAAKNLTVILEPLLLICVGVGVLLLALSVILPIYSVIGGIG